MPLNPEIPAGPSLPVALGRWARLRSGSERVARAVEAAARAEEEGHACVRLELRAQERQELAAHAWVGDGSRACPLVLNADGDCFLWRNWVHEARVAEAVLSRGSQVAQTLDGAMHPDLDTLFEGIDPDLGAQQRAAVRRIVGSRLFVLSGGPGTGKTTTVLRMLLMRDRKSVV